MEFRILSPELRNSPELPGGLGWSSVYCPRNSDPELGRILSPELGTRNSICAHENYKNKTGAPFLLSLTQNS